MKKLPGVFLAGVFLASFMAGCGNSATSPTDRPTTIVFAAQLSSANEVPAVTNADAGASGHVTITLNNLTYDSAGNALSGTADFAITLTGFPVGTTISAAHIHSGATGTNGGVIIDTGLSAEGGVTLITGSGSINRAGLSATASALTTVIQNPALAYFNVHTANSPGGAVRGQLVRQ